MAGDTDGAYAALYKAVWACWRGLPPTIPRAEIDCARRDFIGRAWCLRKPNRFQSNAMNMKARMLKTAVLHILGRLDETRVTCEQWARPLNLGSRSRAVWIQRARNGRY